MSGDPGTIVVLTPWFPNRPGLSNAAYVYESAAALARRGIAVHVLVCRPWLPRFLRSYAPEWMRGDVQSEAFTSLRSVRSLRYFGVPGARFRKATIRSMDRNVESALPPLLARTSARLLHVHTEGLAPVAVRVARSLNVRSVVTMHGINTDSGFLKPAQRNRIRGALTHADRLLLVGEPLRPFVRELVGREDHFRVVPNGFDASVVPRRVRPLLQRNATVRFISVSNLHEGKGIDIALRALAGARDRGLEDWTYMIVGSGYQRSELAALADELALAEKVTFVGAQPPRRVFELLAESDIFVLPSYREAFGIAYLEAMATGLVTIGIRGQGPSMFIESGGTGFLLPPRDVAALTECILQIVARREEMPALGAAAAALVRQRFSWDAHADALASIYEELTACSP